jgi:cytochrome c peroxidase
MSKTTKIIVGLVSLGALAGLSVPLANLILDRPTPQAEKELAAIQEPYFKKAAPILVGKCSHCHATGAPMPFYAGLPFANKLIKEDVEEGRARFNFAGKIKGFGEDISEIELARLENILRENEMPPARYVALHWKARLTDDDKANLNAWIQHRRAALRNDPTVPKTLAGDVLYPVPKAVKLNAGKVALGNQLFHDRLLSANNSLSCASCHALTKGGTDHSRVSKGIRGQMGGINAPTVFNAAYNFVQFWDGRAKNLVEQANGPVQNPMEMGSKWPDVIAKLNRNPAYVQAFNKYYANGITSENVVDAIVTFEQSLITPNSRFDQYLRGNTNALSKDELAGYELFKVNCASCHAGTNLGGLSYERMGWRRAYFVDEASLHKDDFGHFNVTNSKLDRYTFKVPTLRNVAVTWPYFHNGSTSDLRDAVKVMVKHQVKEPLTDYEIDQITAFLKTLTGEYQGKPL